MVATHLGMDGLTSPNNVALHGSDAEMILTHLERISKSATQIIIALETGEQ